MKIFAIADLHLTLSAPDKGMEVFGPHWKDHMQSLERNWSRVVQNGDVVLIPGDISWSASFEQAKADLRWLDSLPGTKVILKGNHDHWWGSPKKMNQELPRSIRFLQNNALRIGQYVFAGTRLWDSPDFDCHDLIDWDTPNGEIPEKYQQALTAEDQKIYHRELERLQISLEKIPAGDQHLKKIILFHYPPINPNGDRSQVSEKLAQIENVEHVVFGHLHSVNLEKGKSAFPIIGKTQYHLVSADYLGFCPKRVV